jgi:hypothetical protein
MMGADARIPHGSGRDGTSSPHGRNAGLPDSDVAWRRRLLRSAGLPEELSRAVAASTEHDVNGLLGLLGRGCPVATALRLTARDERLPSA